MFFKSAFFPLQPTDVINLKMLTPKQMLQRLLIGLAQVKAHNTSENLLIETFQKEIIKNAYNNIMNPVQI